MAETNTSTVVTTGAAVATAAALAIGGGIYLSSNNSNEAEQNTQQTEQVQQNNGSELSVEIPKIEIPKIEVPKVNTVGINTVGINTIKVNTPNINGSQIIIPGVKEPAKDLPKLIAFQKQLSKYFKDQTSIQGDQNINVNNPLIYKWIEIYKNYKNVTINYVPLTKTPRIISEAVIPKTDQQREVLTKNIQFFKAKGYNTILFVFSGYESTSEIISTVKYIKSLGVDVYASYGGAEWRFRKDIFTCIYRSRSS